MTQTLTRRQARMLDKAAQRAPLTEAALLMDEAEALLAAQKIRAGLDGLRALIADFDGREGWRALGYDSFRAWAMAEIDQTSLRHIYRLRDAAEVDQSLGVTIGHTPESHARELASVPAEERRAVLDRAAELAGDRPVQAKDIRAATGREKVVDVQVPPAIVALIDAAQHAAPGSSARAAALGRAAAAIARLPNGEARALAFDRYRQLDAEHYAAIPGLVAPRTHDDDAATLAGAGWKPHASKPRTWVKTDPADGMLWEMELADDADLARTAQLIRERPDLDPDDLMLAADGAPIPSVEEADRVAMLASLDYLIDDLTAAGYTVTGWEKGTPQGTVYTLRRGDDVSRHTLHGLMLMLEATKPAEPPRLATPDLHTLLGGLSRHGWDRVGAPRQRGSTMLYTFRQADDERELAEGELSFWLADLDRSAASWAARARHELAVSRTAATERVAEIALTEAIKCIKLVSDDAIRRELRAEYDAAKPAAVASIEAAKARLSAAEARTVAGAQQQRQANASNPAWRAEGDKLARDILEADERGVILTIAALFDGDGDGLPLASPGELADLEAHLVRATRAWAAGWLVKVGEGTV